MEPLPVAIVCALIATTIGITAYAKRRNLDTGDHYVAGRRLSGWQNGLALAGDQISAASFLGITGAVALTGMTGFLLGIGLSTAFLLIVLLVAEPLRNLGRFTLADAVATRFEGRGLRGAIAVTTLVISTVFMVVQFVGSGLVASALLDIDFAVAVVILGGLMTLYTVVGGMVGATYIQIFKTSLLLVMVLTLFVVVISRTGWNPLGPMKEAAAQMGDDVMRVDRSDSTVSWNFISLNMGLVLGMMGMPHIMVRFLTVRDGRAARSSAQGAMWIFAVFFLLLPIFGFAAANEVGRDAITAANPAGNSAATALAQAVGGDVLFALVAGVVIATVLAVLAGLAIAASGAAAHDLYTNVLKRGEVDERRQLQVEPPGRCRHRRRRDPARARREGPQRRLPGQRRLLDRGGHDDAGRRPVDLLEGLQPHRSDVGHRRRADAEPRARRPRPGRHGQGRRDLAAVDPGDRDDPVRVRAVLARVAGGAQQPGRAGHALGGVHGARVPVADARRRRPLQPRRRRARDAGADYVVPVTRATSASEVRPSMTLCRPSSRSRRMPSRTATSMILSAGARSMARPRISSVITMTS